ncbi:MAG TPA: HIT family protein [Saprospiraceae bacterium]|nr:HIT family protein [Saprospiraceae bacterium]
MASIFSKIITGEIPCHKIAEDERCFSFLDIRPIVYGHTLVVPKQEVDYYFDLDDEYISHLNMFAKRVARALEQEVDCLRIGVMIAGLEVPHAHIHLVPIKNIADLSFTNQRATISEKDMAELASRVAVAFQ